MDIILVGVISAILACVITFPIERAIIILGTRIRDRKERKLIRIERARFDG